MSLHLLLPYAEQTFDRTLMYKRDLNCELQIANCELHLPLTEKE